MLRASVMLARVSHARHVFLGEGRQERAPSNCASLSCVSLERSQVQTQNEQIHYFTLVDGVQFKLNSGQKTQGL